MARGVEREASLLDALLVRLGIEPRSYRALVGVYALMDFRSQHFGRATATGPNALLTPLFWVIGQYLLIGMGVALILFARVDGVFFTLASLGVSMLVVATSVIVEFNEVVLDAADLNVIGHHPVPLRTYAAARMSNLLGYILVVTAALNVVPAIAGAGLRDSGWAYVPAYTAACLMGNLLAAGVVILFYTAVLRCSPEDNAREVLAWTQIILIMVLFYGGQLIFRDTTGAIEMLAYAPPDWIRWLPVTPVADAVVRIAQVHSPILAWPVVGLAVLSVGVWAAVWSSLSRVYAAMQPGSPSLARTSVPALPRPGALLSRGAAALVRPGLEAAVYWFSVTSLKRDAEVRMRVWPSVGIVLAALVLGIATGQMVDPWASDARASAMSLACVYLLAIPLPPMMHAMLFSRASEAAWLWRISPGQDLFAVAEGIRKALIRRVMLPLWLVVTIAFACTWKAPLSVALHSIVAAMVMVAAGYVSAIGIIRDFPGSRPIVRGTSSGTMLLWASVVNGAVTLLAVVHAVYARSLGGTLVLAAGLLLLIGVLHLVGRRALAGEFAGGAEA